MIKGRISDTMSVFSLQYLIEITLVLGTSTDIVIYAKI